MNPKVYLWHPQLEVQKLWSDTRIFSGWPDGLSGFTHSRAKCQWSVFGEDRRWYNPPTSSLVTEKKAPNKPGQSEGGRWEEKECH